MASGTAWSARSLHGRPHGRDKRHGARHHRMGIRIYPAGTLVGGSAPGRFRRMVPFRLDCDFLRRRRERLQARRAMRGAGGRRSSSSARCRRFG